MDKEQIRMQIEDLKANLKALERELNKPDEFEFNYKELESCLIGMSFIASSEYGLDYKYIDNFRYRQTESNAKADFQLQKELMCIGALAEQIDPDYKSKVIWGGKIWNCSIYFSIPLNKYLISNSINYRHLGVVYMPEDVAEKVCEILNNKEVEL